MNYFITCFPLPKKITELDLLEFLSLMLAEQKFIRSDGNHDDKLTFDEFLHSDLAYDRIKKEEFDSYDTNS